MVPGRSSLSVPSQVSRSEHVIDARLQLHRQQAEPVQRVEDVLAEAFDIADGRTFKSGTTAHTCALVALIRSMATDHQAAVQVLLRNPE